MINEIISELEKGGSILTTLSNRTGDVVLIALLSVIILLSFVITFF